MAYQYKMLLGGIGDDAHSVGLRLLDLGFAEMNFSVKNLGIRNRLQDFFKYTDEYDIILISNKNGHAELYLEDFPYLLQEFKNTCDRPKLWYLGGSLSVSESDFKIKKKFLHMGFTNVYPRPISFQQVYADIEQDIHIHGIPKRHISGKENQADDLPALNYDAITNRKWTWEELKAQRKEVLLEWGTGKDINHALFPTNGVNKQLTLDEMMWSNKTNYRIPLFQPRTGVADIEDQISLLQYLEQQGSDISSVQLDAASRSGFYDKAEEGRQLSIQRKSSQLNGFPIPVYKTSEISRLVTSLKKPFQLRGGGPDHRFTYEIALHGGITALEGGFICYCMPYDKLTNPVDSLNYWQYIDSLCATFGEQAGVLINREYFGTLTATLIEPSIAISVNVIQALLSAQQGVKSISVGYAEQGNRSQDVAAMKEMDYLTNFYLEKFGFCDTRVTTVFHQYMAAFPADKKRAEDLIFNSSITATLANANKVMVKTSVEAIKIPDRFDNAQAVQHSKRGAMTADQVTPDHDKIAEERKLIRYQTKRIIDTVLELGDNNIGKGAVKAIEEGIIDIPWSPNIYNKNKVVCVRDIDGAIRFYEFSNLPFDSATKEFHQNKISLRETLERESSVFNLLEKDLSRIWKNDYVQWPLDGVYVN